MPYQMIHLQIADALAQNHPMLLNNPEFFLGTISPDAIHARRSNTTTVEKYGTHLKPAGPDGLKEVTAYWAEQGRSPFHIGYGMHVMTDRLWTRFYPSAFPNIMRAEGGTRVDIYRPDVEWIDWTIYKRSPGAKRLLDLLRAAVPPARHPYLTSDEISRWRDDVIEWYEGEKLLAEGLPKVLTLKGTVAFMEEAVGKLEVLMGEDDRDE